MTHPKSVPPSEENTSALLNRLFEEAVRLHGGDWKKVVNHVKARAEALEPGERAVIAGAFEQLLAFSAPDFPVRLLN
jgi:hypothetical protein